MLPNKNQTEAAEPGH